MLLNIFYIIINLIISEVKTLLSQVMKRLFFYIVFIAMFFNTEAMAINLPQLPDDFEGEITRARVHKLQTEDYYDQTAIEYGAILWEIGKYFYEKYPDLSMFYEEDFYEKLRPFFPDDSDDDLKNKQVLMRNSIAAYRGINQLYNDQIKERLVPHTYRAVHSAEDYDHPDEVPYIEAPEGEFVKVYNFKKFLSYGHNADEKAAIADFEMAHDENAAVLDKIDKALEKFEWKKFPYYGIKYQNPLLSTKGISKIENGRNLKLRLLSRNTYVDGNAQMYVGVQILTDSNHFVLANNVNEDLRKISIDLSDSQNVKNYEILYPAPFASKTVPAYHKYFGDFLIPIKIEVADVQKPVLLKAEVKTTTCGNALVCFAETFYPQLRIEAKGDDIFPNGYDNYFAQTLATIPQATPTKFQLHKFVVDQDNEGESLRLEFDVDEKVRSFRVYVEEKDGNTTFSAPLISILDGRVYARLRPLPPLPPYSLKDLEYVVTAVYNDQYYYRNVVIANAASTFDVQTSHLNMALILLAILGGIILNFMPCVFPVLSLKMMTVCRQNESGGKVKQSLKQTVIGIFFGMTVVILGLLLTKKLGYSLGWGMQFQNMGFLVTMTFVLAAWVVLAPKLDFQATLPQKIQYGNTKSDFLIGTLIILLATPCTGPYLATAIGYALTGSYTDIVVLLYAVALGLSVPYLLILLLKNPQDLFPKPGPWMNKLNTVMQILLYVTIIWFFVLIYGQTDGWCVLKLLILLLVFFAFFWLYTRFMAFLDERFEQRLPTETELKIREKAKFLMIPLFALFVVWGSYMAQQSYRQNYERHMQSRQTAVDMHLINEKINKGRSVLVEIGADWCMTCHYNTVTVLTQKNLDYWHDVYRLDFVRVDWTDYNADTLEFMARYGRKGLPFYILYTPLLREGIVLPELFDAADVENKLQALK